MVDQVKVVADQAWLNSCYGAPQTDIFSLLPLAVPLVRGCLWVQRLALLAVDHFRLYDHRFYALFRDAGNGGIAFESEYKSFSDFARFTAVQIFHPADYWFCWVVTARQTWWRSRLCSNSGFDLRLSSPAGGDSAAADAQSRHREMFGEMPWFAAIVTAAIVADCRRLGDALSVTDCGKRHSRICGMRSRKV